MSAAASLLGVALVLLWITLVGYAVARLFGQDLSRMERIAWGFACGLLLNVTLYGVLIALHTNPGPKKLLAGQALLLSAALIGQKWKRPSLADRPVREAWPLPARLGLFAAAAGVGVFLVAAVAEPMWTTDYLAIWGFKGKTIFFSSAVPSRLFHDPQTVWSHPEYPLLLPLLFASLSASVGGWNDRALALLYPVCQAVTALLAYGFLARRLSRASGRVAAVLIALFFPLYVPVSVGMADIPLALGLVLASTAFLDALIRDTGPVRLRLGLAALFAGALKQEGSFLLLLMALSLLFFRTRRKSESGIFAALCLGLPVLANWGALRLLRGPLASRDFDLTLLSPERIGELLSRTVEVAGRILLVEVPAALLFILAAAGLLLATHLTFADRLLLPLAAAAAFYAGVCALSAFGAVWMVETSFARIVSALFPAFALVLGARWPRAVSHAKS